MDCQLTAISLDKVPKPKVWRKPPNFIKWTLACGSGYTSWCSWSPISLQQIYHWWQREACTKSQPFCTNYALIIYSVPYCHIQRQNLLIVWPALILTSFPFCLLSSAPFLFSFAFCARAPVLCCFPACRTWGHPFKTLPCFTCKGKSFHLAGGLWPSLWASLVSAVGANIF